MAAAALRSEQGIVLVCQTRTLSAAYESTATASHQPPLPFFSTPEARPSLRHAQVRPETAVRRLHGRPVCGIDVGAIRCVRVEVSCCSVTILGRRPQAET